MTDYGALLRDHVTLRCRSIDRIFLQAYVPKLQTVGLVCTFLRWQRKFECARERDPKRVDLMIEPKGKGIDQRAEAGPRSLK